MNISLSTLKENPAKYFELAKTDDVIVTRRGKRLGRIVCEEKALKNDRQQAFEALMKCLRTAPSIPDNTVYDETKEERLRGKELL